MDEPEQARAYAEADFAEPHDRCIQCCRDVLGDEAIKGRVLDLGCGPADITIRFARAYPDAVFDGVDGAEAMLAHGRRMVRDAGLDGRIYLHRVHLPAPVLPGSPYDAVVSNSLLHHLDDPMVIWETIKAHVKPGAPVYVMDLMRPVSREKAQWMIDEYAAGEPEVLRKDFFNSLLAAYEIDEVKEQLGAAGLGHLKVEAIGDRHLIVYGKI